MKKAPRTIRKQSQREIKKPVIKMTKNIFLFDSKFKSILPKSIYNKLALTSQFAVSLLGEFIGQPEPNCCSLQLMKLAFLDQESVLKELTINMHSIMDSENTTVIQNPEEQIELSNKQHINETKQSINSNNEVNHHLQNDFEDNIFLPLDSLVSESKRQYNEDNHDFFHFEERNFATSIPPHEQLDILSLID